LDTQFYFELGRILLSTAHPELQKEPVANPQPDPSPEKFFETLTAYQHTAALKAAIELDLFTAIGDGQNTVQALAKKNQWLRTWGADTLRLYGGNRFSQQNEKLL
jgi:hypothetical protein